MNEAESHIVVIAMKMTDHVLRINGEGEEERARRYAEAKTFVINKFALKLQQGDLIDDLMTKDYAAPPVGEDGVESSATGGAPQEVTKIDVNHKYDVSRLPIPCSVVSDGETGEIISVSVDVAWLAKKCVVTTIDEYGRVDVSMKNKDGEGS